MATEEKTKAPEPAETDTEPAPKKPMNPQSLIMAVLLVLVAGGILFWSIKSTPDPLDRYRVKPTVEGHGP